MTREAPNQTLQPSALRRRLVWISVAFDNIPIRGLVVNILHNAFPIFILQNLAFEPLLMPFINFSFRLEPIA